MTTFNEKLLSNYVKHQTYMLRYARALTLRMLPRLVKTEKQLYDELLKWISKVDGDSTLSNRSGRKWQKDFERALYEIRRPAWEEIIKDTAMDLTEYAVAEATMTATIIHGSVPVTLTMALPPVEKLVAIVNSQPFEGRTLKEWMERTASSDVQDMLAHAKIGIVQGRTPTQIARSIVGSKATMYKGSVARKAFTNIESTLLTLTNGIQNDARQALYEANSDIIKQEMIVATLDIRTTLGCASLDGTVWERGKGPMPPLHFRCRTVRVPYINFDNLGNRGFDSSTQRELLAEYTKQNNLANVVKRGELPRGHKTKFDLYARKRGRELMGTVPATMNFNEWFKSQTRQFQNEFLGPTRAELYRNGQFTLDRFVDREGKPLTLQQLKQKGIE